MRRGRVESSLVCRAASTAWEALRAAIGTESHTVENGGA